MNRARGRGVATGTDLRWAIVAAALRCDNRSCASIDTWQIKLPSAEISRGLRAVTIPVVTSTITVNWRVIVGFVPSPFPSGNVAHDQGNTVGGRVVLESVADR
jgi:hypothetical protein